MRHPLPYAFARTAQLLLEDDGHQLVLWHGPSPDAGALSEVLRKHPVQQMQPLDAPGLAQRISASLVALSRTTMGRRKTMRLVLLRVRFSLRNRPPTTGRSPISGTLSWPCE